MVYRSQYKTEEALAALRSLDGHDQSCKGKEPE